jgi:hypothetical protein
MHPIPLIPYITRPIICFNVPQFTVMWQDIIMIEIPPVMLNCNCRCSDFETIWRSVEKSTHWLYNGLIRKIKAVLFNAWDIRGVPRERENSVKCVCLTANAYELAALMLRDLLVYVAWYDGRSLEAFMGMVHVLVCNVIWEVNTVDQIYYIYSREP